jgi:hypothetical protein
MKPLGNMETNVLHMFEQILPLQIETHQFTCFTYELGMQELL